VSAAPVLVDTGPLVALFDPSDRAHAACRKALARLAKRRLVTTLSVVTEATYLLAFSGAAQQAMLAFVCAGAVELVEFRASDLASAATLVEKYDDLPMDLADATLVVLADRLDTLEVFTLDRRDFSVYRRGRRRFVLIPVSA
jgi:predicted nucleic acid-binding protein